MTKIFDSKLRRFVDQAAAFPVTQAAEARAVGKTQDCGCGGKPRAKAQTTDTRMRFADGRAWRIEKTERQ